MCSTENLQWKIWNLKTKKVLEFQGLIGELGGITSLRCVLIAHRQSLPAHARVPFARSQTRFSAASHPHDTSSTKKSHHKGDFVCW